MNDWLAFVILVGCIWLVLSLGRVLARHWEWLFVIVPATIATLYWLNAGQLAWAKLTQDFAAFQKHEQIAAWWAKKTPMQKAIIRDYWTGDPQGEVTSEELEEGARWDGALKESPYSSKDR